MKKIIEAEVEVGCGVLVITFRAGTNEEGARLVREISDLINNKTPEISEANVNYVRSDNALVVSGAEIIIHV